MQPALPGAAPPCIDIVVLTTSSPVVGFVTVMDKGEIQTLFSPQAILPPGHEPNLRIGLFPNVETVCSRKLKSLKFCIS